MSLSPQPGNVIGPTSVTLVKVDPLPALPKSATAAARLARFARAVSLVSTPFPQRDKWRADVAVAQDHARTLTLTDNPVESGVVVTDHSRRDPDRLTFVGVLSETPFFPLGFPGFLGRAQDEYRKLQDFFEAREPLFVATSLRVYESMLITSLSTPRNADSGAGIEITVGLRELRIQAEAVGDALIDDAAAGLGGAPVVNAGTLGTF